MPKPRPEIIANQHEVATDAQAYVAKNIPELIRRGQHVARDGFPSSSGGGSGGGSEISRPTENTALAERAYDRTGDNIREIIEIAARIYQDSLRAANLTAMVMKAETVKNVRVNEIPDCVNVNCQKPLTGEGPDGRGIAGRCRNCYDYRRTHQGEDRPRDLVENELRRAEAS